MLRQLCNRKKVIQCGIRSIYGCHMHGRWKRTSRRPANSARAAATMSQFTKYWTTANASSAAIITSPPLECGLTKVAAAAQARGVFGCAQILTIEQRGSF